MNKLIYSDIIEASLMKIPHNKNMAKIKIGELIKNLTIQNPIKYSFKNTSSIIKKDLQTIFPLYNNKKKKTKFFKITRTQAICFIKKNKIIIRPEDHFEKFINETWGS